MTWQTSYYHYDGQGSAQLLTDENGNITDQYCNTAFGEPVPTGAANPTPNPFQYVGREGYYLDIDTGDYYVRARVYRPILARWLSGDPIMSDPNLYRYVRNSPIVYVDPTGLRLFNCSHWAWTGGDRNWPISIPLSLVLTARNCQFKQCAWRCDGLRR